MKYSDWRYELDLVEGLGTFLGLKKAVETGVKAGIGAAKSTVKGATKIAKAISGRKRINTI